MNARYLLALIIVPMGLIIAAVPQNTTHPYKLTAQELLRDATGKDHFVTPDAVADLIIQKDPGLQLIDVRTPDEFEKFSLPGAINIPVSDLLAPEYADIINQDVKMNVFYSNGTLQSNQAWMITRQLGYENNYILQGGLNYWAQTIMNPSNPPTTSPDEEIARYDFRKGASMALGGGALENIQASSGTNNPVEPIVKKASKKKVQGGC
jgi:sulfur-carrier protein adenylyltransferase/sulfurtransferase